MDHVDLTVSNFIEIVIGANRTKRERSCRILSSTQENRDTLRLHVALMGVWLHLTFV